MVAWLSLLLLFSFPVVSFSLVSLLLLLLLLLLVSEMSKSMILRRSPHSFSIKFGEYSVVAVWFESIERSDVEDCAADLAERPL